jgi:arylsulfatase A-like enzyme
MVDKHYVMYDDVVRVPLLMRWPAAFPGRQRPSGFVSSAIDLASTFCEAAGLRPPPEFAGESLLPALQRQDTVGPSSIDRRTDIYASYHGNQFGLYSQRMVRDRCWKYVWNPTATDELYDLSTDPAELHNRSEEPDCAGELARLRKRLIKWLEVTHDPLLNEWTVHQLETGQRGCA